MTDTIPRETRAQLEAFLTRAGLMPPGAHAQWTPLAGGVSADVWKCAVPGRVVCVKRILPALKVKADWKAPLARSQSEWDWMRVVRGIVPDAVPEPLAHDADAHLLAMGFLPPERYPGWKAQLQAGHIDVKTAEQAAAVLAAIHNATAHRAEIAARFATDDIFFALRLDAYLLATARAHPALARFIAPVASRTAGTKQALVHGDVSPKNILAGPRGPVFLDSETAWYGDPAFDAAFCLNHFLLKAIAYPQWREGFAASFAAFGARYLDAATFAPRASLEARIAALLPILFLARVDGKSPVEYLTDDRQKASVRAIAIPLIEVAPRRAAEVWDALRARG